MQTADLSPADNASPPTQSSVPALSLPVFQRRSLPLALVEDCAQLFFRQSFINDYLHCPQMSLYRWILALEQRAPFFAATMGTAGHAVIFNMHEANKFDYEYMELFGMLETEFHRQLKKEPIYPQLPKGCETPEEAFVLKAPEYVQLLWGYEYHPRNREFKSTMHEQSFVMEIPSPPDSPPGTPPYLFTGQIDQGGYYQNGQFVIRDMKFRDNSFRPSKTELDLNVQATIYTAAVKYGVPACENCRPRNIRDPIIDTITLEYNGPCEDCRKKIGTPKWPQRFADMFEMIWMNDFNVHEKDQHDEFIINRDLPKIPNPSGKGQKIYQRTTNPEYHNGYKKGHYKGVAFMPTVRPPSSLHVLMSDVLRVCDEIRKGTFYRQPGETCNFLCPNKEACLKGLELEVQQSALDQITSIGTEDPF